MAKLPCACIGPPGSMQGNGFWLLWSLPTCARRHRRRAAHAAERTAHFFPFFFAATAALPLLDAFEPSAAGLTDFDLRRQQQQHTPQTIPRRRPRTRAATQ
uniref:Uncharacterized protein n=1 Tax=Alexandrium catenella TaxID=2925 RepID=A0A7S1WD99_ALECA|mmetsp:Transcript_51657/g.138223  ORF Transcript_51657/g.138223 Transcript_51657/m.138223 type:complete len:101 (+) Transcript_51657:199-501(+)